MSLKVREKKYIKYHSTAPVNKVFKLNLRDTYQTNKSSFDHGSSPNESFIACNLK